MKNYLKFSHLRGNNNETDSSIKILADRIEQLRQYTQTMK